MAGLRGLHGVMKKICSQDSLQINIWDPDHMNKLVAPFLLNMHDQKTRDSRSARCVKMSYTYEVQCTCTCIM